MIPGNTSSQGKYVDPPTSVSASAGNAQATISFTLPAYDGKGTATYVATASPGGATASGASSPLVVTGLSNGTSYTFTVSTISGYGVSVVSGASSAVTPSAPAPSFAPSFGPSFGPSFQACNGCVPGQYGYYGGNPNDCNSTTGWSYSCEGQQSFHYYQSACCPDLAVCGAFRPGVCGYTTPVTPSFGPEFGPTFGPTFGPDFSGGGCSACGGGAGTCLLIKGAVGCYL